MSVAIATLCRGGGSAVTFEEAFSRCADRIERQYGVPVVISDVAHPFTGDLDGAEIRVDFDQSAEESCFIVAHLFGHTVQWNLSERYREIGTRGLLDSPTEEVLQELVDYEREAARYSLQLFIDAGCGDLCGWLSDWSAADLDYLLHFYRTGEKLTLRHFFRSGRSPLEPLAIPEFHPTRWVWRWDGVVI